MKLSKSVETICGYTIAAIEKYPILGGPEVPQKQALELSLPLGLLLGPLGQDRCRQVLADVFQGIEALDELTSPLDRSPVDLVLVSETFSGFSRILREFSFWPSFGFLFQLIAPPDQRVLLQRLQVPPAELVIDDPAHGVVSAVVGP